MQLTALRIEVELRWFAGVSYTGCGLPSRLSGRWTTIRELLTICGAGTNVASFHAISSSASCKLGQYYAWWRNYDTNTGRWTTPDPACSPCWNLFDYANTRPASTSDPRGLKTYFINGWTQGTEADEGVGGIREKHTGDFHTWDDGDAIIKNICDIKCADPDEPICLVGYSYGAMTALQVARHFETNMCECNRSMLIYGGMANGCAGGEKGWHILHWIEYQEVTIDYIALIDTVDTFRRGDNYTAPGNVGKITNFYNSIPGTWLQFWLFWLRMHGRPMAYARPDQKEHEEDTHVTEGTDHPGIPYNEKIRKRIISDLKKYDRKKKK